MLFMGNTSKFNSEYTRSSKSDKDESVDVILWVSCFNKGNGNGTVQARYLIFGTIHRVSQI